MNAIIRPIPSYQPIDVYIGLYPTIKQEFQRFYVFFYLLQRLCDWFSSIVYLVYIVRWICAPIPKWIGCELAKLASTQGCRMTETTLSKIVKRD